MTTTQAITPKRDAELDALRGLAALAVALGHCVTRTAPRPLYDKSFGEIDYGNVTEVAMRLLHLVFNADAAVILFFVLSGHVLITSLAKTGPGYLTALPAYAVRRVLRIYPVLIFSFVPFALIVQPGMEQLVANALLWRTDLNGVTWSLQIELIGSLIVFAVWCLPARLAWLLPVAIVASALWVAGSVNIHTYLPLFLMGCFAGSVRAVLRPRRAWLLLSTVAFLGADFAFGPGARTILFQGAMATLMVANAAPGIAAWLASRPVQFLGKVSYPFYLLHPSALRLLLTPAVAAYLPFKSWPPLIGFATLALATCAIALPAAWYTHRLIELRGIALGSEWAKRLRPKRGAMAAT